VTDLNKELGLGTVLVIGYIVWLRVIRNWRKLHNVELHKLYLSTDVIKIMDQIKKMNDLFMLNQCDMRRVYRFIRNPQSY
jgi:hypothetical protein